MKKSLPCALMLLGAVTAISGCASSDSQSQSAKAKAAVASQQDLQAAYDKASEAFIEDLWKQFPGWASYYGYRKYDHRLVVRDAAERKATLAFIAKQRQRFGQFNPSLLSSNRRTDWYMIVNRLESLEWSIKELRSYEWDPSEYNIAGGFAQIINSDHYNEDDKMMVILRRLENVPAFYMAAKDNLLTPTLEHTELAITQNKGAFSVISEDLLARAQQSGLSDNQKRLFKQRYDDARGAIEDFIDYLEKRHASLKASGKARSFRIGSELYTKKFAYEIQSSYTAEQVYRKAMNDKKIVQQQMAKLADKLWGKYFKSLKPKSDREAIDLLIKRISQKHVKREEFVDKIREQIPALEAFVREKDLITLDPEKPLVVRETPPYMRGYAGASISAPGPYDKHADTYYNVTPLDNMTDEQAESYLREYNHWMLQILNIHEAIPGHYTQLVYANLSPSLIKAILRNGAMVEGWAVYTERMMLEEGYGDFEPEMWLMYYKWNLRVIANTILDYSVHNLNMTKEGAMDLLVNQAFQEQAEAEGKWRRAKLSQVQLTSYYTGFREIYDFREAQKRRLGKNFDLKTFHETFLSYGKAPVKYIKQLMQ